jgi:hypothetical protein
MDARFDDICRVLAAPIPRRHALRVILAAVSMPLFRSAFGQSQAQVSCSAATCSQADAVHCFNAVPDHCCPKDTTCCGDEGFPCGCCGKDQICCQNLVAGGGNSGICCDAQTNCCEDGKGVVHDCCLPDTFCCPSGKCCADPNDCCGSTFLVCCPAPFSVCCDDRQSLCCSAIPMQAPGACCKGTFSWQSLCCKPGTECCQGTKHTPTDCCVPPEECVNGRCIDRTPKFSFSGSGGGTTISTAVGKSLIRFTIGGTGFSIPPDGFGTTSGITGGLTAFNFNSQTLITSVTYDGVQGRMSSADDEELAATGTAKVNGVLNNFAFLASKSAGAITYEILNADTGDLLAGGTGETGLADFGLTMTPM